VDNSPVKNIEKKQQKKSSWAGTVGGSRACIMLRNLPIEEELFV